MWSSSPLQRGAGQRNRRRVGEYRCSDPQSSPRAGDACPDRGRRGRALGRPGVWFPPSGAGPRGGDGGPRLCERAQEKFVSFSCQRIEGGVTYSLLTDVSRDLLCARSRSSLTSCRRPSGSTTCPPPPRSTARHPPTGTMTPRSGGRGRRGRKTSAAPGAGVEPVSLRADRGAARPALPRPPRGAAGHPRREPVGAAAHAAPPSSGGAAPRPAGAGLTRVVDSRSPASAAPPPNCPATANWL